MNSEIAPARAIIVVVSLDRPRATAPDRHAMASDSFPASGRRPYGNSEMIVVASSSGQARAVRLRTKPRLPLANAYLAIVS